MKKNIVFATLVLMTMTTLALSVSLVFAGSNNQNGENGYQGTNKYSNQLPDQSKVPPPAGLLEDLFSAPHVVENLSGLVICQLAKRGAPVIFGGSPSSFDMRKGTTPMGAIETMMIDSAYAQIGKYFNLPTHAYMGLSDSKINDAQAGFETGIGAIVAALSGVNVVSGPGMMNFESCQSLEKLVIDNEICGMAYRLIDGISQRDEPIAKKLFEGFTSDSQFLSMPHTKKWYRREHTFPKIVDRDTYDYWVSLGGKSIADRASEEVEKILQENPPHRVDRNIQKELRNIMIADAQKYGISSLPEITL